LLLDEGLSNKERAERLQYTAPSTVSQLGSRMIGRILRGLEREAGALPKHIPEPTGPILVPASEKRTDTVGAQLDQIRKDHGVKQEQVAQDLEISLSKVQRMFGRGYVSNGDLNAFLDRYDVPEEQRQALLAQNRQARAEDYKRLHPKKK
jgi:hypothetical protein